MNIQLLRALRGITAVGDIAAHSKAVGALIALGHNGLAWRAEHNFRILESRARAFKEFNDKQWQRILDAGGDPTTAIFDGSFPVNPIHELIVQAEAERAAIVAEVDAIAGGF